VDFFVFGNYSEKHSEFLTSVYDCKLCFHVFSLFCLTNVNPFFEPAIHEQRKKQLFFAIIYNVLIYNAPNFAPLQYRNQ
jgi:hypothetical protein